MIDVVIPDVVEMSELGTDAAEIVPDAGQNGLDLLGDFSGKAAVRFSRPIRSSRSLRPDEAGDAAKEVCGLVRIEIARRAQQADRQRATAASDNGLAAFAQARLGAEEQSVS